MKDVKKLSEENARILVKELDEATKKHQEFIRERDIRLGAADAQGAVTEDECEIAEAHIKKIIVWANEIMAEAGLPPVSEELTFPAGIARVVMRAPVKVLADEFYRVLDTVAINNETNHDWHELILETHDKLMAFLQKHISIAEGK